MISLGRKFLAELIGTFLLVFFGAGASYNTNDRTRFCNP